MIVAGCAAGAGGTSTVPNVTGMDQASAVKTLNDAGLIGQVTQEANAAAAAGTVLSQAPTAGAGAPKGTAVAIVVATSPVVDPGPAKPVSVTVPRVVNQQSADAAAALEAQGLIVVTRRDPGGYAPRGQVVSQDPRAGTAVQSGTTITLYVSYGRPMVSVPSVVGLTSSQARARLSRAGLANGVATMHSKGVPKGRVMHQSIQPGTSVTKGTTIKLDVSMGPPPITVPNVIGKSDGAAAFQLKGLGFKVSELQHSSSSVPKGVVMDQSPSGGSKHAPGTTVHINVSSGTSPAPKVKMPNVVGLVLAAGSEELRQLGFSVDVKYRDDPAPEDQIIDQLPDPGAMVTKGAKVTIFVSQGQLPQ
jgi:beta-lactam-binding protein with PASTA domain